MYSISCNKVRIEQKLPSIERIEQLRTQSQDVIFDSQDRSEAEKNTQVDESRSSSRPNQRRLIDLIDDWD